MSKILIILTILLFLGTGGIISAQEETSSTEAIQAQDLVVSKPNILPDSPFYFFKNLGRGIQNILTSNPVKKAELKEKFANEKLLEIKKMVEKNKNQDKIIKAIKGYQKEVEKNTQNANGNEFKNFKNLEILKELETKVPEKAKEAIRQAQENALKRLKDNLSKMSPENQQTFKSHIENSQGNAEEKLEILENVRSELKENPQLREKLLETRDKILNKVENKDCPIIEKPGSDFCKDGRVVAKKNDQGCIAAFNCLIPGEFNKAKTTCVTLWDPICGKDSKTYSNKCFARAAGVEIASAGECGAGK